MLRSSRQIPIEYRNLIDWLNDLGDDDWELATVVEFDNIKKREFGDVIIGASLFYFKRRLESDEKIEML